MRWALPPDKALLGRWDLTVHTPGGNRSSWLEVELSGNDVFVGRFVGTSGSARPISRVITSGDSLHFSIPPQWEEGTNDLTVAGRLTGAGLSGTITFPDGKSYDWTGVRAPALRRQKTPTWGTPIRLLHANDLGGWHAIAGGPVSHWQVHNGILQNTAPGSNIATERTFGDFKLHVEFRYPKGSNSGIYLRGRHELQIQDDYGKAPWNDLFGSIYGFISPTVMAARPAGEWQTYDVTLVGRMITVVANGQRVICDREIPGITGEALDSNEGAPGPLMFQGSEGAIEIRNIVLTPAR